MFLKIQFKVWSCLIKKREDSSILRKLLGDEDIGIEVVKRRKSSTVKDEHKNGKQVKHKEEIKPSLVFF